MKKQLVSFFVLISLLSGSICLNAQKRSLREMATYEKEVWAKGLPAAKKELWDKQPLTPEEQIYFDSLQKRVGGGIGVILTILLSVYGRKKYLESDPFSFSAINVPPIMQPSLLGKEEPHEYLFLRKEDIEDAKKYKREIDQKTFDERLNYFNQRRIDFNKRVNLTIRSSLDLDTRHEKIKEFRKEADNILKEYENFKDWAWKNLGFSPAPLVLPEWLLAIPEWLLR